VDLKVNDLLVLPFNELVDKVSLLYRMFEPIFKVMAREVEVPEPAIVADDLAAWSRELRPHVTDTRAYLLKLLQKGERVMIESAQALMLDPFWGTSPYTSSGTSTVLGAAQGTGLPPEYIGACAQVTKVAPTRVGVGGPMPSEYGNRTESEEFAKHNPELFKDTPQRKEILAQLRGRINAGSGTLADYGRYFQILGYELGATSGRGRSTGALDLPWLKYANQINRPKFMALTRFDMLSGLRQTPVVEDYLLDGKSVLSGKRLTTSELARVKATFLQWPGFEADITGATSEAQLPIGARKFLDCLEIALGTHIAIVGTGPGPNDRIFRIRTS
jgi:adenylosuccinate synthase